jgi:hypothetical protein
MGMGSIFGQTILKKKQITAFPLRDYNETHSGFRSKFFKDTDWLQLERV